MVEMMNTAGDENGNANGGPTPVPALNETQQTAANAARGFGSLQCEEAANAIQAALSRSGHSGQVVELRGGGERGYIVCKSLPGNGPAISQNGRHLGVRVGDLVFDNLHPDGMPYEQWIRDFDAIGGVKLHSTKGF